MTKRFFSLLMALVLLFGALGASPAYAIAESQPRAAEALSLLQFTSGGHALGFTNDGMYAATGSHALHVNFINANRVQPQAPNAAASTDGSIAPLSSVTYLDLWPGISLDYTAAGGIYTTTYSLAPGADANDIQLRYNAPLSLNKDGTLTIAFESGALTESAPIAWQEMNGRRVNVDVAFSLSRGEQGENEVGFALGKYDPRYPLTIDPTLTWNTFLGGSGSDPGESIAVDNNGNVYVGGYSGATWGSPLRAFAGGSHDAFVAKLDASGTLQWNTFLGGSGDDSDDSIAVDGSGNIYVGGSSNATWGSPLRAYTASSDAFIAKLDSSGVLQWHTFLGGSGSDPGESIAVDNNGNVYVGGYSGATWGSPLRAFAGGSHDVFVAKLDSSGILQWHTFLGGSSYDYGFSVAVDGNGNVYVGGYSGATWGSPLRAHDGWSDAFVAKLDSSGVLQWHTFLGGSGFDDGKSIVVDGSGNVYVGGSSGATWGSPLRAFAGDYDTFVAKLESSGTLLWNTFLGGSGDDRGEAVAVDGSGNVYVSGYSKTTWGSPERAYTADKDAFAAILDSSGTLTRNSFLGGGGYDSGYSIAVDGSGKVYVGGSSGATWGSPLRAYAGGSEAFVAVILPPSPEMDLKQGATPLADGGSQDFGSHAAGSDTDLVFTIENTGTADLTLTTPISIGGADADQFSLQVQPTSPVSASGSMTFTVRFTPTSTGAKTASLSIANNDSDENPYDLTITGTGLLTAYTLSGNAGMAGATLTYTGGSTTADGNGDYAFSVDTGWSGMVTPSKTGYTFTPASITISTPVTTDLTGQNFTATLAPYTLSGNAGIANAILTYTGGTTTADDSGNYSFAMASGWTGTVTPTKAGYTFSPASKSYTNLTADLAGQDYVAHDLADDFVIKVKTNNSGVSSSTQFRIPTAGSGYNYNVDCNNDGVNEATAQTGSYTCNYAAVGTYTLRIQDNSGLGTGFPRIYFNNGGDRLKLLTIEQWGRGKWTSMAYAFYGCANLAGQASDSPDLSGVTDLSYMFRGASAFNQNIGSWNTASVTNLRGMFYGASAFNQNIGSWNTANVTDMSEMFISASVFNQPLVSWDTTKVTNMSGMFAGASAFNQPIGDWNTASVTNLSNLFSRASAFNQPIGDWNTASVTNMSGIFAYASAFNRPLGSWDTSKVTNMSAMFHEARLFNQPIGGWNTASVTNMSNMFYSASAFNQDIGGWNTAKVTDMNFMFGYTSVFNQPIGNWNTASVTNMSYMFQAALAFNQPIGAWNTAKVTNMGNMFWGAGAFNQDIGSWDITKVTNLSGTFAYTRAFNQPIGNWNTARVTDMSYMFYNANAFNQPIESWNTAKVTDMSYMFYNANAFNQPIESWNTVSVTNMSYMFRGALAFNQPIGTWNTAKVTDLSYMFSNASDFNQNLGGWNIGALISANNMFDGVTLSTPNYDALLNGWDAQTLRSGVTFSGGNSQYCFGGSARNHLITARSWTITDGGSYWNCFTISGNAGIGGATLTYTGGSTTADSSGNYSFTVLEGWSGTVTPFKPVYTFAPASRSYINLTADQENQDYTAARSTYTYAKAGGTGDCASWVTACSLQTALTNAISGDEIWVIAGMHKPTTGTDRYSTFQLKSGVAVYGGFIGTETARAQRNPAMNITILSGDLQGNDNNNVSYDEPTRSDNSLHVVTGANNAILDGFTIMGGNANHNSFFNRANTGGGMYNYNNSPTVRNVKFSQNSAEYGGGMCNDDSSPTLTNVIFSGNKAISGGGISNINNSNPILTNVTFSDNSVTHSGGGIFNAGSNPILTDVTFSGNSANNGGGGIYNNSGSPVLTNVTFSGNSSANNNGGGIYNYTNTGSTGNPILTNATFSGNSANNGGGIYNLSNSNPQIRNAIFWGNTATISGAQIYNSSSTPTVSDSVVQGGCPAGSTCTNIITTDPLLGILGNYGGFTQTIPILAGSSAIDAGNDAVCPAADQRGVTRPQGARCDIGAYETVDPTAPIVTAFTAASPANSLNIPITVFTAADNVSVTGYLITESAAIPGAGDAGWTASAPTAYTVAGDGSYTLYPWAKDAAGNVSFIFGSPLSVVVDTIAPDTQIDSKPADPSNSAEATLTFSSADASASFECSFEGGAFAACASPKNYSGLTAGSHTFAVRAKDPAGNTDATPASYTWTIDLTAPDTQIDSKPADPNNSAATAFTFSSADATASFECSFEGGAFAACASPKNYSGLTAGSHTFAVRAKDPAGNLDSSPASYTWTIDLTAPDTQIDSRPANPSNSSNASFTFSSTDSTATFECSLDNASFAACTSLTSYSGLAAGSHTFAVRAKDPAGNLDATPASHTWTIDLTAPDTQIDSKPADPSNSAEATFTFSSADATASFECSLEGGAFAACTSPTSYTGLTVGSHTFAVRAKDPVGNLDASPASYTWTIDLTAPDTQIDSKPADPSNSAEATFTFSSADATASFECSLEGGAFAACASPKTYGGLAAGSHTFAVRAKDPAGNLDATPASHTWTIDLTAPDTQIDSKPADPSNSAEATFTFSSADAAASFECSFEGGAFVACVSPKNYSGLAAGSHAFAVRAKDPAGNLDSSPASYTWMIDLTAPTVVSSLRTLPSATNATNVDFTVTFSEAVTGVNAADFGLTSTGSINDAAVTGLTGSGATYTATVSTGTGSGTLRLDVVETADIKDLAGSPLGGLPYTGGETYVIAKGPFPSTWVGGVSIASDQNVVAVARPHLDSEVASYIGSSAGATTQYVPMLFKGAFGGTYNAALYLQNVSATAATLSLQFTDSSGAVVYTKADTLDPHASKGYWLPAETGLPNGFAGGVKVTSTQPILAVGRPHIGAQIMTYNGMSAGATSAWLPMFFKNGFGSYNTALYVQNVTGSSANLTIQYINLDGTVACTDEDVLGANASRGYWSLSVACDTGSLPSEFVGGVKVTSTQDILTVGRAHLGTQITTYNGSAAGATSAYVPMLFKNAFSGGSYDAALYLQNVSGSSANVQIEYLNSTGAVAATQNVTLAANAISSIWLPTVVGLPDDFTGGARITSTQDVIAVARPHLGSEISAYNGAPAGSLNASLPMLFKDAYGGGYDAAFYVQNTSASAANVEISFYDSAGALSCVKSIDLAAGATQGFWMPTVTCEP